jgi:hypothetical protein
MGCIVARSEWPYTASLHGGPERRAAPAPRLRTGQANAAGQAYGTRLTTPAGPGRRPWMTFPSLSGFSNRPPGRASGTDLAATTTRSSGTPRPADTESPLAPLLEPPPRAPQAAQRRPLAALGSLLAALPLPGWGSSVQARALAAARAGRAGELQTLLKQAPELLTAQYEQGESLLTIAAAAGHQDVLLAILAHARLAVPQQYAQIVNHRHRDTALALAVAHGHLGIARALAEQAETDVNRGNGLGQTPLHHAAGQDDPRFAELLLGHPDIQPSAADSHEDTPLYRAVCTGRNRVALMIIRHPQALPDQPNLGDDTVLRAALRLGSVDVVETLLASGQAAATANRPDRRGQTPVWQVLARAEETARSGDDSERAVLHALLAALAASPHVALDAPGPDGDTPLTWLCRLRRPSLYDAPDEFVSWQETAILVLLGANRAGRRADLEALNAQQQTPVQAALAAGNVWIAQLLLDEIAQARVASRTTPTTPEGGPAHHAPAASAPPHTTSLHGLRPNQ